MTGKNEGINETVGDAFVEVSIKDAQALNVVSGDRVAVSSKRGKIVVVVKVTENIKEGVVFIPFHFAEAAANRLTNAALDPVSDIPEYKVCAVKVETI